MSHAQFSSVIDTKDRLVLRDDGPWNCHPTVTNDAAWVVDQVSGKLADRMLLYFDSDGDLDRLLVKDGRFAGFSSVPDPRDSRIAVALALLDAWESELRESGVGIRGANERSLIAHVRSALVPK